MIEEINKKWVLNKSPEGMPDDDCWKLEEVPIYPLILTCEAE